VSWGPCYRYSPATLAPFGALVFTAAIEPSLPGFLDENVQRCSALLTLFQVWAEDYRLRPLLAQPRPAAILPHVFSLLNRHDIAAEVVEAVYGIADVLLGSQAGEEGEEEAEAEADGSNSRKAEADEKGAGERDDMSVILPHVSLLLDVISRRILREGAVNTGAVALSVLTRLTPHMEDPAVAMEIVGLLLPFLCKPVKQTPDKTKTQILLLVHRTLKVTGRGMEHVRCQCARPRPPHDQCYVSALRPLALGRVLSSEPATLVLHLHVSAQVSRLKAPTRPNTHTIHRPKVQPCCGPTP